MENFFKQLRLKQILRLGTASAVLSAAVLPGIAFAATFNPTLLVNTESFLEIDDGDGTTNIQLFFGTEELTFDVTDGRFEFTDDLQVQGNLAVTGTAAVTGAATFGSTVGITGNTTVGGTLGVTGTSSLTTLTTSGLATLNSASVTNNATVGGTLGVTGNTTVGGTLGVTGAVTITGATTVNNTILATGNISTNNTVVLNADGTADTAVLTFGGSSAETLSFTSSQFTFSDDLQVQGNLAVTGTAAVTGAATFGSTVGITGNTTVGGTLGVTGTSSLTTLTTSGLATLNSASVTNNATVGGTLGVTGQTNLNGGAVVTGTMTGTSLAVTSGTVRINGVTYNVTGTQGGANTVLVNDGSGNLTWQSNAVANSSGSFMSLHPVYPNVTYKPDGTNNTGQLSQDVITNQNYYIWSTTRGTAQDYDMYVRLQVPENFASWATNGVQVLHNNAGAATVRVDLIDTAGATQAGSATGGVGTINITPSGTYTAGSYMTVKITVSATSAGAARVGYVNLRWITTTP
jgi:predicted acyltransferase (DUF342 family)